MSKKVFLGMSGGVDSSVSALLLKEQGYDVTGIYMKNWSQDLPGMKCPWAEDLADAKRVAVQLDLDFEVWDFEKQYRKKVVDYMLAEFQNGRTPNPDIMCNQEIKFKLFYETALERGADFIATGHYARTNGITLLRPLDHNKDQTYFLYRMSAAATEKTIFPLANLTKPEVKAIARQQNLDVANKKESMGVCFVGEVGMKDFLQTYLPTEPGEIRELETDRVLGYHEGSILYTVGQRHGLYLGGGLPYYVAKKDLKNNLVYVSRNLNADDLWATELALEDIFWRESPSSSSRVRRPSIAPENPSTEVSQTTISSKSLSKQPAIALLARLRHRGELIPAHLAGTQLIFEKPLKRPASGQSVVFYDAETSQICLGGGIIA